MVTYKSKKFWLLSSSCKLSLPISDVTFTICTATRTFREKKTTTTSKQSQKKKKQGKRSQARKCFWRKFDCIFCIKLLTSKFHVFFVQNKGNEINKCAARAKPVCSSVLLIKPTSYFLPFQSPSPFSIHDFIINIIFCTY